MFLAFLDNGNVKSSTLNFLLSHQHNLSTVQFCCDSILSQYEEYIKSNWLTK